MKVACVKYLYCTISNTTGSKIKATRFCQIPTQGGDKSEGRSEELMDNFYVSSITGNPERNLTYLVYSVTCILGRIELST